MGQAKQRRDEIQQLKAQGPRRSRTDKILTLVAAVAKTAEWQGVRLNNQMIFADADAQWYQALAQEFIDQGVKITDIWQAQDQHDQVIRAENGVDLSRFNGDISLMTNYDPLARELGQLPAHRALEAAILNGIVGYYSMRGHNPHFRFINMADTV